MYQLLMSKQPKSHYFIDESFEIVVSLYNILNTSFGQFAYIYSSTRIGTELLI